jgi:hypothetical protein
MSFGPIVDVAIGLILVFLLVGLIVSSFQELVLSWMKLRGKYLRQSIADLLTGADGDSSLFHKVYGHALIQGAAASDLPSYVPSRSFALALIDTVTEGSKAPVFGEVERQLASLPEGVAKQTLRVLVTKAGGDIDMLKTDLAQWYDDAMDRLSGRYKRFNQAFAFFTGLAIAVALNVDTIRIGDALMHDSALREKVVAAAQAQNEADKKTATDATTKTAEEKLQYNIANLLDLNLPIGWEKPYIRSVKPDAAKCATPATSAKEATGLPACSSNPFVAARDALRAYFKGVPLGGYILVIVGWLITGFAASLGAPFWFDTLQRFLQFRGTGKKPATAAEEGASS